mmetsp:Transcript_68054/g.141903  ORF Transcript_68054/g.141903 Transcript_68054/m.141903 type:complete len:641 (-) Transcript_68054:126-2048(-)|eukprot:CAMPEP_0181316168 /NCGR_PEP_ID=MMETSP1101-20121128/15753_1 /TAXON_ID=46948 /ORGANISM="Rhodomonas abbreviata, Strain Caron Lab Isolate" /LENGTH=640 /DNA_ID=CAMNT_0023423401 /DNA_START=143 /DNA_END=2065 /DNA_ORIENTATION=-
MSRSNLVRLFKAESTIQDHVDAFKSDPGGYAAELLSLVAAGVSLSSITKARAAAILWRGGDKTTVKKMLGDFNTMGVVEVLSMAKILDSKRKITRIQRTIAKCRRMKLTKRLALNKEISAMKADSLPENFAPGDIGASGALMKHIRRWIGRIDKSALEFFLLARPKEPWQELTDLCHANPSDFQLEYFLPSVYGAPPPDGSIHASVENCKDAEDIPRLLASTEGLSKCYSWIRTRFPPSSYSRKTKEAIARHIPLEEALTFYEELAGGEVDPILEERIRVGEGLAVAGDGKRHANFGKLMERLLLLRRRNASFAPLLLPHAEEMLRDAMPACRGVGKKVAVLGDASQSMQMAIDASAIIACSVCSAFQADLSFFNTRAFKPPVMPRNAEQTCQVAGRVKATGATSIAACLMPYYERKEEVDLFVVVTDEEENTPAKGTMGMISFAPLFELYIREVYPHAKLFFVSFLAQTDPGAMISILESIPGMQERTRQFKFDPRRPDLTKLATLLGLIAVELSDDFLHDEDSEQLYEAAAAKNKEVTRETGVPEVSLKREDTQMGPAQGDREGPGNLKGGDSPGNGDSDSVSDLGFLVSLCCLDGTLEVEEDDAAAASVAFPAGTDALPISTVRQILDIRRRSPAPS